VIEDLDRFDDLEIFEKLREVNNLLKNSNDLKSLGKKIQFLYVVRESIFLNENEKNKFFDIIISIVPYISSQNSKAKMLKLFEGEIEKVSKIEDKQSFKDVIKIAALCIDEMRTIHSIYNDYLIYTKIIEQNDKSTVKVFSHELLAIIIYKNLFPLDFEYLNSRTSKLDQILDLRSELLDNLIKKKKEEVKSLKHHLNNIESEQNKTIKSLRTEYLTSIIVDSQINANIMVRGIEDFHSLKLDDLTLNENFKKIKDQGVSVGSIKYPFEDLEKHTNNDKSYNERVELIELNSKEEKTKLLSLIQSKNNEIKKLNNETFANIIKQAEGEDRLMNLLRILLQREISKDKNQEDDRKKEYSKLGLKIELIKSLILNRYISTNYKLYTSIFHDGDLSYKDRELYIKFKSGEVFEFDQHFENPVSFLEQFDPPDWNNLTFLCEELVDQMLNTHKFDGQLDLIFNGESDYLLKFLDFYLPTIPSKNFLRKLSKHIFQNWRSFTEKSLESDLFGNSNYDILLPQLLLNHEINIIQRQNKNNILSKYISEKQSISEIFPKEKSRIDYTVNELPTVFKILDISFTEIRETEKSWVLELIYKNNLYEININMLTLWGNLYGDKNLEYPTYSNVMKSPLNELQEYVNANLVDFLVDVLLKLKDKFDTWEEDEKWLVELLNKDGTIENANINKIAIINEVDFYKFNLKDYEDSLWESILANKKLKCTWENLISYFEKMGIDNHLIDRLDNEKWIQNLELFSNKIEEQVGHDKVRSFIEALLELEVNKNSLAHIIKKHKYLIRANIISENTKKSNIKLLITLKALSKREPIEVYEELKAHFSDDLLHMEYALEYDNEILNHDGHSQVYESLNKNELIYITRNEFPEKYFVNAFFKIDGLKNMIFTNQESKDIIEKIKKFNFTDDDNLLVHLFTFLQVDEQVSFFNWLFDQGMINKTSSYKYLTNFKSLLRSLDKPRYKFVINDNSENKRLLNVLKQIGLIKKKEYMPDKDGDITFYRNHFNDFDS